MFQKNPETITLETLSALDRVLQILLLSKSSTRDTLVKRFHTHILLDWRIWICTTFNIQKAFVTLLNQIVVAHPKVFYFFISI